jgi:glucan phosphoethanolaminetransferase (alkaline phosphatase superfamily)
LHTYTAASVPQILTRADSINLDRAYTEESLISILNRCSYHTIWLANQTPDYTYDGFAKTSKVYENISGNYSAYSDVKWTDEDLLARFKYFKDEFKRKQFICLHTIGSHWYYNYRYPDSFEKYRPVTKSRSISHNTSEEIINAYDNSILYMDFFVDSIIEQVEDKNAILVYLSDHGELLGENGMWLHATEHEVLHDSGCFIWMSENYKNKYAEKYLNALQYKDDNITTSFLFHSLLNACGVETAVVEEKYNIFSPKR